MVAMKLLILLLAGVTLQFSAAAATAAEEECRLYPVNYTFVTADVQREPEPGCNNANTYYTVCSTPSRLTDSQLGPQHNPTDNSSYYIFQGSAQSAARYYILFTFDQTVDVYNITLHYFIHDQSDTQPTVRAFGVEENFELQNIQSVNLAGIVRLVISRPPSPSRGLHSASNQGGGVIVSSKVVLDINFDSLNLNSDTNFCLSKVEFFTDTSEPCPEPPTISSTPATTEPPTDPPTTEPPTTATAPTTDPPVITAIASPTTTDPPPTVTDSTTTTTEPPSPAPAADVPTAAIAAGVAVGVLLLIILVIIAVITFLQCSKRQRKAQPVELTGYTEENEELQNTHYEPLPTRSPLTGETTSDELDSGPNTYATISDVKEEKINLVTSTEKTVALVTDPNISSKEERDVKEGETKTGIFENPDEFYAVVDKSKKLSNKESNNTEKEEGEMKTGIFQNPEEFYAVVDKSEKLSKKESNESNEPRSAEDDEKTAQPVYAVVHKPAKSGGDGDSGDGGEGGDQPVLPPHTADMLYTAVIKKGTCAE